MTRLNLSASMVVGPTSVLAIVEQREAGTRYAPVIPCWELWGTCYGDFCETWAQLLATYSLDPTQPPTWPSTLPSPARLRSSYPQFPVRPGPRSSPRWSSAVRHSEVDWDMTHIEDHAWNASLIAGPLITKEA